jgi:ferredoxin
LIAALRRRGYRVIGPRLGEDAVIYDEIDKVADLPAGWGDAQEGGQYRLRRREDGALFGYTLAPQSWKRELHPPRQRVFAMIVGADGIEMLPPDPSGAPMAFVGVRACELAAIGIQDRVFAEADPGYGARRRAALVIAVECAEAAATCFCASLGTGPDLRAGYDIRLVELADPGRHRFLARAGSAAGAEILAGLECGPADAADLAHAAERVRRVAASQTRKLEDAAGRRLAEFANHARWDEVAGRCLVCGNCTMVCPTCFCTTMEDVSDLAGTHVERWRSWDSCFSLDFSYLHGGSVRPGAASRYRQWITHKLSTWHDQFDSSGCVGCGRCITWCPVGIDITEEVRAIVPDAAEEIRAGAPDGNGR